MFQAISETYSKNYLCFPWQLCIGAFSLGFLFFAVDLQGCFIWVNFSVSLRCEGCQLHGEDWRVPLKPHGGEAHLSFIWSCLLHLRAIVFLIYFVHYIYI